MVSDLSFTLLDKHPTKTKYHRKPDSDHRWLMISVCAQCGEKLCTGKLAFKARQLVTDQYYILSFAPS